MFKGGDGCESKVLQSAKWGLQGGRWRWCRHSMSGSLRLIRGELMIILSRSERRAKRDGLKEGNCAGLEDKKWFHPPVLASPGKEYRVAVKKCVTKMNSKGTVIEPQ